MRRLRLDATGLTAIVVAATIVALYWLTVTLAKDYYVVEAPASSVYDASGEGFKTYFAYLDALGIRTGTVQDFESLPKSGTIVAAAPFMKEPTAAEQRRIARWVRAGNRLVIVGTDARSLLGALDAGGTETEAPERRRLRPLLPTVYANGVSEVALGPGRVLADTPSWVTHLKDGAGQGLVSQAVGRGEVVWLSDAYPLTNDGIGVADDAALGVALVYARGEPVYFDEYHHGYVSRGGVWERLGDGGRVAVLLVLIALALALFEGARRLGAPIAVAAAPSARDGGAYIASLAELYRKAGARAEALETMEDGLARALVRRYGTLQGGLARVPEAKVVLGEARAAREGDQLSKETFIAMAGRLRRVRREVEG